MTRIVTTWALAAGAILGLSSCGSMVEPETVAVLPSTTTTTIPPTTTTTWNLPQPFSPPENDDYFEEPVVQIGTISIPRIGLETNLQQGISLLNIDVGPSHWPGTALPGELGNTVVAGHRVTHSRPFRHLDDLVPGDTMTITVASGTYQYAFLSSEIVTPDRVDIATQQPAYTATLFACHPPGSARERIVAYFEMTSEPAPGQPSRAELPPVYFPLPPPA